MFENGYNTVLYFYVTTDSLKEIFFFLEFTFLNNTTDYLNRKLLVNECTLCRKDVRYY